MPIEIVKRYSRNDLKRRSDALFAFGDNMARQGYGGQAAACRGEPNAVGIPTKWRPSNEPGAFFSDTDYPAVMPAIVASFVRLADHIRAGGDVIWPADGVGTGLADLPARAPRIATLIARCRERLDECGNVGIPT